MNTNKINNNPHIGSDWDDLRNKIFTPEEIAESDLRVALIGELIKARHKKKLSQSKLSKISKIKQPVIARLEHLDTDPKISTLIKLLLPLNKTLKIVSIHK
jgi:ribosome-binding protein aMBF1 (putative translation factor)